MSVKFRRGVLSAVVLLAGLLFFSPFLLLALNSFKTYSEIFTSFLTFPKSFYLDNYREVIRLMNYPRVLGNTVLLVVLAGSVSVVVSFLAGYAIHRNKSRWSEAILYLFTFGLLIPIHSLIIPIAIMGVDFKLINNYFAIASFYVGFYCSFGIFMYTGFFRSVSGEIAESARIDGCGLWRLLTQILFPLMLPATTTMSILFIIWTWNDFLLPMLLIGNSHMRTLTINQYIFVGTVTVEWNLFIASLILSISPMILMYIAGQKYIVEGLTSGAVK